MKEAEEAAWSILPSSKEVAMIYDNPSDFKSRIIRQASRLYLDE